MLFNNPDTLLVLISVFFAVAGASVLFAVASLRSAVRELRTSARPRLAVAGTVAARGSHEPVRHAA